MADSETISAIATKKKPIYPVSDPLRGYLLRFTREQPLPVTYQRLDGYAESVPVEDKDGNETLWHTVIYPQHEWERLSSDLTKVYAVLKAGGDLGAMRHLYCDRVDYCLFGNSNPFRVRIVNARNDNQDYFYVKQADASRIYGLELEHLLSPNRMHYLTCEDTLIEEHIVGIPGDQFIEHWLEDGKNLKPIRVAKELVKFNERCFIRLLGDMRSYNFVAEVTFDFEEAQFRLRPLDFDQQSYSGRMNFYRPQFFKENLPLVDYTLRVLDPTTVAQYQREEQALIYRRMQIIPGRLKAITRSMAEDRISTPEKVAQLRSLLAKHYEERAFLKCQNMGQILNQSLHTLSDRIAPMLPEFGGSE